MAGKDKIHPYVDSEIFEAFKNYVFSKYGTLHKYLGLELTKAMEFYLRHVQQTHTRIRAHFEAKQKAHSTAGMAA